MAALDAAAAVGLNLLLGYLALPIDLVPDVIPGLGYADDAILVAVVLRSVLRRSSTEAIRRHWPGSPDGLAVVWRLCGLPGGEPDPQASAGAIAQLGDRDR